MASSPYISSSLLICLQMSFNVKPFGSMHQFDPITYWASTTNVYQYSSCDYLCYTNVWTHAGDFESPFILLVLAIEPYSVLLTLV